MNIFRKVKKDCNLAKFSNDEKSYLFASIMRMKKVLLYVSEDTCCVYGSKIDIMSGLTKLLKELIDKNTISVRDLLISTIGINYKDINSKEDFNLHIDKLIKELESCKNSFKE